MKPDFSFIIPCYKASGKIAKVIGSMLDQDYKSFEIICVLDGPDEMAESIIKVFPDVKYKVIEHGGACKARNEGFKMSRGKYVIFSDADVYWRPGMLRIFNEKFEKSSADFVYGGFRWTDTDGAHLPYEFDPYLLTTYNYIDTGNPVKREWVEKVGGWDESLKRWQDWDLWQRIVKAGAKGLKIEDITRDADFPTKDGISGQDNYAPTYHIVRKKHTPYRDICITSIAAYDHALRIAKMCEWDFWTQPAMLPNDYKAVYLLGMFPESVQDHVSMFMDGRTKQRRDCVYLIHWIGTDVLNMRTSLPFIQIKSIRKMFEKYNVIHLVQSEQNAEELRELGFKVRLLPLPVKNDFERLPLPEKFTVTCYDHGGIDQKWHKWLVMELVKAMPDIDFKFYGNKHAVGKERNMEWLGKVPIKDIIAKSSALLRLTIHDGYPVSAVEFMFAGRKVITNVSAMEFSNYVNLGVVDPNNQERIVEIKQKVYREIRKVQMSPVFDDFEAAKSHYEEMLNPETFKNEIMELVEDAIQKRQETTKD